MSAMIVTREPLQLVAAEPGIVIREFVAKNFILITIRFGHLSVLVAAITNIK